MTSLLKRNISSVIVRPVQYRDMEGIERLNQESFAPVTEDTKGSHNAIGQMQWLRQWYGVLKFLSWFPNPLQYMFFAFVAEQGRELLGMIQVSPFNNTRSTWRIDRVMLDRGVDKLGIGSQVLRHCFETILEARTWILEVNINDTEALALYRHNGFQRLAEMTYWELSFEQLKELSRSEPDLPNLLPVSNADAQLLCQLDTASMPPLVRQVFDRNKSDFKTSLFSGISDAVKQWMSKTEVVSGYVFEPQRKAAIGHFQLTLDRKGKEPHFATLTVHPAYTWLYPELLSQLARVAADFPPQVMQLASADYQSEREEYLEQIGAKRISHTLVMSRSVWHKLRESKLVSLEGIQWQEMLQGLQPARKPIPGGMSWGQPIQLPQPSSDNKSKNNSPKESINFSCNTPNLEPIPNSDSSETSQE
jgi:ribosomal protein S18 acetylase RimI-like enzyme